MPTPAFYAALRELSEEAYGMSTAQAVPGLWTRPWQLPDGPDGIDVQDPSYLTNALDREALNALYVSAFQSAGTPRSVAMAAKSAIDYLGAYERSLHARHAAPARCRAWAAARRYGHGSQTAGVFWAVAKQIEIWAGTAATSELGAGLDENELVSGGGSELTTGGP